LNSEVYGTVLDWKRRGEARHTARCKGEEKDRVTVGDRRRQRTEQKGIRQKI